MKPRRRPVLGRSSLKAPTMGAKRRLEAQPIPERQIQRAIITALRLKGALVNHNANSGSTAAHRVMLQRDGAMPGWPDLTVLLPGGSVIFMEVKSEKGRVSQKQRAVHEYMRRLGHRVAVVRSVQEAVDAIGPIRE